MDSKNIHEKYHTKTMPQYKIIDESNFTYRIILSVIENYVKGTNRILDIGCGAGTLSFYLAAKGNKVLGIDISSRAVNSCRKTAKNLGINKADFKILDFPNEYPKGKFNVVLLLEVIEHLKDDEKAIKNINKLLERDGILLLSTPSINAPLHKFGLTKAFDKEVGHLRRYTEPQLISLLTSNGFKIIEFKKTEGILRNFLFVNSTAGKLLRLIKFFLSDFVTLLDNLTVPLLGASNYIVVARRV